MRDMVPALQRGEAGDVSSNACRSARAKTTRRNTRFVRALNIESTESLPAFGRRWLKARQCLAAPRSLRHVIAQLHAHPSERKALLRRRTVCRTHIAIVCSLALAVACFVACALHRFVQSSISKQEVH
jgi:hypothetical protein